jgi:uncharacterized membrane protein HdeD (DUF308 family)
MGDTLVRRGWGTWVLMGLAALVIGIIALAWPKPTAYVLVVLIGIFFLLYGVLSALHSIALARSKLPWVGHLVWGVLGIIAGIVTFAWPKITAVAVLYLIAIWAIVTGIVQIYTAFTMHGSGLAKFLFAVAGLISVVVGLFLIGFPAGGATAIVWLIGAYFIVVGIVYMVAGFELRHLIKEEARLEV